MASLNRVELIGTLGQDPQLRYTPTRIPVVTLNLATNTVHTDKEGDKQEKTEWHRVIVWNKQAENCARYLAKGRLVFIEGRLQTRSWDDKTGGTHHTTEIIAGRVQFLNRPRIVSEDGEELDQEETVAIKATGSESRNAFPAERGRRLASSDARARDLLQKEPF